MYYPIRVHFLARAFAVFLDVGRLCCLKCHTLLTKTAGGNRRTIGQPRRTKLPTSVHNRKCARHQTVACIAQRHSSVAQPGATDQAAFALMACAPRPTRWLQDPRPFSESAGLRRRVCATSRTVFCRFRRPSTTDSSAGRSQPLAAEASPPGRPLLVHIASWGGLMAVGHRGWSLCSMNHQVAALAAYGH